MKTKGTNKKLFARDKENTSTAKYWIFVCVGLSASIVCIGYFFAFFSDYAVLPSFLKWTQNPLWPLPVALVFGGGSIVSCILALKNTNKVLFMVLAIIASFLGAVILLIFLAMLAIVGGILGIAGKGAEKIGEAAKNATDDKIVGVLDDRNHTVLKGNSFGIYHDEKGNQYVKSGDKYYRK